MKRLEILVPHYHEEAEVIKPLLDSIALQQNVDFNDIGVIICHDGEDIEDFCFLEEDYCDNNIFPYYPFSITQIHIPHKGVSAARNGALDASTAEYVMFCDADDIFYNACGIWLILRDIEEQHFDTMTSVFLEETRMPDTGKPAYLIHEDDSTFVHGKVHRRKYLIEKGIRWNEALTVHEDSYFNILCRTLTDKVWLSQSAFYLWKWRDDSVCRHDPATYILKTYRNLIDSSNALVEEYLRREMTDRAKFYVVLGVFDAYYTMNKPEWVNQDNRTYRDETERHFAEFYRKWRYLWDEVTEREKVRISVKVRENRAREGMGMERVTIDEWLKQIEQM